MKQKRVIVITGASSGIGLATANLFLQKGDIVLNLSRTAGSSKAVHVPCDVTDDDSVKRAFESVIEQQGKIDIVVLNAGFGISGSAEFSKIDDIKRQFDVNFFGTARCVSAVLPHLRKSKGRLIFVSSMAGVLPIPYQSFYSASKSALCSYVRCLRTEIKKFEVTATAVLPGDIKTAFTANRKKNSQEETDVYGSTVQNAVATMEKDEQEGMPAEKIGQKILKLSQKRRPKALYTVGLQYKFFKLLAKLLPNSLQDFIISKMYK